MKKGARLLLSAFVLIILMASCSEKKSGTDNAGGASGPWADVLAEARGQEVTLMMWQGDPLINRYMNEFVTPAVKEQLGITLKIIPGQGNQVVSLLMSEMEAGKTESSVDFVWINGETFFQLRQIDALHGPFTNKLANNSLLDWNNPFIATDFQQKVDGYECPWGNVQMAMIYNSEKVSAPPQTRDDLETWVKSNPGKFTLGMDFTGMTFLKALLADFSGGRESLSGEFDEKKYEENSAKLWEYLNRIKPWFWNEGRSFPQDVARMHQLFSSGELWFTMSNNDAEVDNKIIQGLFPGTSRAYVPSFGSIQNSHYLGITQNSGHKSAAMAVINFMISPEAQWKKMDPSVWGDGTVLDLDRLPAEWKEKFEKIPGRKFAPSRSEIRLRAIAEPSPQYMIRLFEDFRKKVAEQ